MIFYAGADLTREIERRKEKAMLLTGLNHVYERDFVSDVRANYFEADDFDKVLVISGLRATGKTFGLLQAIENMEDSIYICAQKEESETSEDYIQFLKQRPEKNVIIDEYSWIKSRERLDYFLWTLVENGKRVAITGTDSIALDYLNYGTLIHRVAYVNVNMFTYDEFCRVYQRVPCKESCEEYLRKGGLFREYAIENFNTMVNYIETAVLDNLANCINIPRDKARAIIYDVMYLAVCDSDEEKIHYPKQRRKDADYIRMLSRIGIDSRITFDSFDFNMVSDVLIKTGFVVKTYNIYDCKAEKDLTQWRYRLHLTNPSLTYQMVSAVFDGISAKNCLGKAFEACVVTYMSRCVRTVDNIWYADMGRRYGNPELEIVIVNSDEHQVYLFDSKLREAASLSENSSLVSDKLASLFSGYDIGGRYVIGNSKKEKCGVRNGKKVIFTRLDCDTLWNYTDFDENYDRLSKDKVKFDFADNNE